MTNFFWFVQNLDLNGLLLLLFALIVSIAIGGRVAESEGWPAKLFFWIFLICFAIVAFDTASPLWVPVIGALLGYIWTALLRGGSDGRSERKARRAERERRRHEIQLAKASRPVLIENNRKFYTIMVLGQTLSGVLVWFITDRVLGFEPTGVVGSIFIVSAILLVLMRVTA